MISPLVLKPGTPPCLIRRKPALPNPPAPQTALGPHACFVHPPWVCWPALLEVDSVHLPLSSLRSDSWPATVSPEQQQQQQQQTSRFDRCIYLGPAYRSSTSLKPTRITETPIHSHSREDGYEGCVCLCQNHRNLPRTACASGQPTEGGGWEDDEKFGGRWNLIYE